jgi:hypothetical protein
MLSRYRSAVPSRLSLQGGWRRIRTYHRQSRSELGNVATMATQLSPADQSVLVYLIVDAATPGDVNDEGSVAQMKR